MYLYTFQEHATANSVDNAAVPVAGAAAVAGTTEVAGAGGLPVNEPPVPKNYFERIMAFMGRRNRHMQPPS